MGARYLLGATAVPVQVSWHVSEVPLPSACAGCSLPTASSVYIYIYIYVYIFVYILYRYIYIFVYI